MSTLYLDRGTAYSLRMFGPLQDVIQRVVDDSMAHYVNIELLPAPPPRDATCIRYRVEVHNRRFEAVRAGSGYTTAAASLRRLVYWFVENEMWEEYGWKLNEFSRLDSDEHQRRQAATRSLVQCRDLLRAYTPHDDTGDGLIARKALALVEELITYNREDDTDGREQST